MYAVIATGGKQYKVSEGDIITIVDDEPQLNDAVYVTGYFYVE